jgi:hypothetical protein
VTNVRRWTIEKELVLQAVYGYSHVGNVNLHLIIPAMRDDDKLTTEKVDRFMYA